MSRIFNGFFYATAANVIPVLLLAIAVQGASFDDLAEDAVRAAQRSRSGQRFPVGSILGLSIAGLILIYAAAGEIVAIIALARQRGDFESFVGPAPIVLTVAAAARPGRIFFKAV